MNRVSSSEEIQNNFEFEDEELRHSGDLIRDDSFGQLSMLTAPKTQSLTRGGSTHSFEQQIFSTFTYCNLCKDFMWGISNQGVLCNVCGFSAHSTCIETAIIPPNCRLLANPALCGIDTKNEDKVLQELGIEKSEDIFEIHHWIEGNVQMASPCFVCHQSITSIGMESHRCSRCKLQAHTECLVNSQETICTPLHEKLEIRRRQFYNESHSPLLVFVNSRSGGQQGVHLLRKFRRLLNPNQVFDLDVTNPKTALQTLRYHPNLRILCCGGDGTVGWVLSALDEFPNWKPEVAILPLGTGNDLARTLNWGGGYNDEKLSPILKQIETARPINLDRWNISISIQTENGIEKKNVVMNNYFSIGVDASVALSFHNLRNEAPVLCSSRIINKFWYFVNGVRTMIEPIPMIDRFISIEIDGRNCWVNENIGAIICLNLPSYMGGANLWGTRDNDEFKKQSISDNLIEVVAVTGTFHLANVSLNLASAIRIGQGRSINIKFNKNSTSLPVQIDGEPWLQHPCEIQITHLNQARMLKAIYQEEDDESMRYLDFEGTLF